MRREEGLLYRNLIGGNLRGARESAIELLSTKKSIRDQELIANLSQELKEKIYHPELTGELAKMISEIDLKNVFFPDRLVLSADDKRVMGDVIARHNLHDKLVRLRITNTNTTLIYGRSGVGKTLLAQNIAYKANLPCYYVNFANLINSALGKTGKNIMNLFDFVAGVDCVMILDEVDAIAIGRGIGSQAADGEMNRVVINLLQGLDKLQTSSILIATTNRYEVLDKALLRRFSIHYEMRELDSVEKRSLVVKYLNSIGYVYEKEWLNRFMLEHENESNAVITNKLERELVRILIANPDLLEVDE